MPVPVRNYLDRVSDTVSGAMDWIRTDSTELEKFEAYREQRRTFGESLKKHKLEYSAPSNIKICAITYNVAELEEIEDSSVYASLFENGQEWDVLAIALQEVDVGNYALAMEVTGAGQMWSDVIEKELLKVSKEFVKVLNLQLVGVMLLLFVKSKHTQQLRHLHHQGVRLGRTVLGGRLGNKGCLAVRFTLYDRSFLILGGHFAALQENLDNRNADYKEVRSTLRFPELPPDADDEVDKFPLQKVHDLFPLYAPPGYTPPEQKAFDVDYCLWMGDLNYRVDLTYEEVIDKLKVNDYESLRQKDQLMRCKKEGICFPDFDEGVLDFHPSFKYDIGTQVYDTSAKHRIPSWTDRVLFKVKDPNESDSMSTWLNQTTYRRYEILTSDHRPVGAIFDARVLKSDLEAADKVVEKLLAEAKPKPAYERTQCFCAV